MYVQLVCSDLEGDWFGIGEVHTHSYVHTHVCMYSSVIVQCTYIHMYANCMLAITTNCTLLNVF